MAPFLYLTIFDVEDVVKNCRITETVCSVAQQRPVMEMTEFATNVLASEKLCDMYLRKHGLLFCRTKKTKECGSEMRRTVRKSGLEGWTCKNKTCRTSRSLRTNKFFTYLDKNGKPHCNLSLRTIISIVYVFAFTRCTVRKACPITGCAMGTIIDWYNMCREVCSQVLRTQPKLVGTTDSLVQVDESYFSGRRKYNRGRILQFEKKSARSVLPDWHGEVPLSTEEELNPTSRRIYGNCIAGPWVVGLYKTKDNVRFVVVPDRTAATLTAVIQTHVQPGSVIVIDQWQGYCRLASNGFVHKTVNHSVNFVNPEDGCHTRGIERQWVDAKSFMKSARGPGPLLQSHLDECAWRKLRTPNNPGSLLSALLRDVHALHGLN